MAEISTSFVFTLRPSTPPTRKYDIGALLEPGLYDVRGEDFTAVTEETSLIKRLCSMCISWEDGVLSLVKSPGLTAFGVTPLLDEIQLNTTIAVGTGMARRISPVSFFLRKNLRVLEDSLVVITKIATSDYLTEDVSITGKLVFYRRDN
jgi:hypothetical protein